MRLALASGRLDVDQVLAELSGPQLREWQAFEALEGGLGPRGPMLLLAQQLAFQHERHRDAKKRAAPFTTPEFLPWVERVVENTAARLRAQLSPLVKKLPRR